MVLVTQESKENVTSLNLILLEAGNSFPRLLARTEDDLSVDTVTVEATSRRDMRRADTAQ